MEFELVVSCYSGRLLPEPENINATDWVVWQAAICTAAIVVLRTTGSIPNIAALETTKIKRCLLIRILMHI